MTESEHTAGNAHARLDELERTVKRLWLEVAALALALLGLAAIMLLERWVAADG